MNAVKKDIAIYALTDALAAKALRVGVRVYVNDPEPSTFQDLLELIDRIRNGKEYLIDLYKDDRGEWHFFTTV